MGVRTGQSRKPGTRSGSPIWVAGTQVLGAIPCHLPSWVKHLPVHVVFQGTGFLHYSPVSTELSCVAVLAFLRGWAMGSSRLTPCVCSSIPFPTGEPSLSLPCYWKAAHRRGTRSELQLPLPPFLLLWASVGSLHLVNTTARQECPPSASPWLDPAFPSPVMFPTLPSLNTCLLSHLGQVWGRRHFSRFRSVLSLRLSVLPGQGPRARFGVMEHAFGPKHTLGASLLLGRHDDSWGFSEPG